MTDVLQQLIDKQDNFEIIRDQIAGILKTEVVNQMALATAANKDPALWDLRIFTERSNPWENLSGDDHRPVINVWYSTSNFDKSSARGVVDEQKANGIFNIDCYARGVSSDTANGHQPGDKDAALEAHRALRLVRNILMASINTFLQLRGVVTLRWPQSIETLQPDQETNSVEQVIAGRIAFAVDFVESSPQYIGEPLEIVHITVFRREDGEIFLEAEYDYDPSAPVNTVAPVVSGVGAEDSKLETANGTWSDEPTSYFYQWLRDGVPIAGATGKSYTTVEADAGAEIKSEVTASNPTGLSDPEESSNNIFIQPNFEAIFDTTLAGSPSGQLVLPFTPNAGNLVNWGDGNVNNSNTHDYGPGGVETVRISGTIDDWRYDNLGDKSKLIEKISLGPDFRIPLNSVWRGCANMVWSVPANNTPTITGTNLDSTFLNCVLMAGDVSQWDMSAVTSVVNMFFGCTAFTGIGLEGWNVGNVTNFNQMFFGNSVFNRPIGVWDMSSATNIGGMLRSCTIFNQNVNSWDVGNVVTANHVFAGANAYNQPLNLWDVSSMVTMHAMLGSQTFNQDISMWVTNSLVDASFILSGASAFNQDLSGWNMSNVTNMSWMLKGATSFNQNLTGWNVGNVADMSNMLDDSGLSQTNYDNYLAMCAGQTVKVGVTLGALNMIYTSPSADRNTLTSAPPLWNIIGDIAV